MRRFALVMVLLTAVMPSRAEAKVFWNDSYDFEVAFPASLQPCPHQPDTSNHGEIAYLGESFCNQVPPQSSEYIVVFAIFNASEYLSTAQAAAAECYPARHRVSRDNPRLAFRRCEAWRDGEIEQHKYILFRRRPAVDWPAYGHIYTATLRCRPERCRRTLPVFRRIVASMRFF